MYSCHYLYFQLNQLLELFTLNLLFIYFSLKLYPSCMHHMCVSGFTISDKHHHNKIDSLEFTSDRMTTYHLKLNPKNFIPEIYHHTWRYGPCLNIKTIFPRYGDSMLEIRQLRGCLIFNMGIPILVRQHLYIEIGPWGPIQYKDDILPG